MMPFRGLPVAEERSSAPRPHDGDGDEALGDPGCALQ